MNENKYIPLEALAAGMNLPQRFLRELALKGKIPCLRIGGRFKFNPAEVQTEFSTDGATATRVFTVEFDNQDDSEKRPLLACGATGMPLIWSLHPYNPWLYCRGKRAFARGPITPREYLK